MWALWMDEKSAVVVGDGRAWPMLMRWCIRQGDFRDKVGPCVYEEYRWRA